MFELSGKYNTCKVFTDNVDNSTISQLTSLMNQESIKDSQIRIMSDCLLDSAEVLTINGFKFIKDLNYNDLVANYDLDSKSVFFKEPKNIIKRELRCDEKVYDLYCKQSNFHFYATENHRVLTNNGVILCKDLEDISYLKDYVYFSDFVDSKYLCNKYPDDILRLLVWVVCDGSYSNNGCGTFRIEFDFCKERKIDRVVDLLKTLRLDFNTSFNARNYDEVSIMLTKDSSAKVMSYLNYKKEFPFDFMLLPKNQVDIVCDELIQSDGDYTNFIDRGTFRFNTTSKHNLDIIQGMMVLNGYYANYKLKKRTSGFDNNLDLYYIDRVNKSHLEYSKSGFHHRKVFKNVIDYDGYVYCITCDSSFFVCRYDGNVFITGNCHSGKGCVIGTTMTLKDKVIPNLVGVDIGCFTGDTLVWTNAMGYQPIADLVDKGKIFICSYDSEVEGIVDNWAIAKKTRENADLIAVEWISRYHKNVNTVIRCTPDHKFMLSDTRWVEAKDLKPTDILMTEDNDGDIVVVSVTPLEEKEDVYCLTTCDNRHNFCITDMVVVHNCGMLAAKLDTKDIDFVKFDKVINNDVPSGFDIHETPVYVNSELPSMIANIDEDKANKSLGSLGGGNHFIEVDKDSEDNLWLVIHTGSRHLGIEVCDYWQGLAYENLKLKALGGKTLKELNKELVEEYTVSGRKKEISKALKKLREDYKNTNIDVPHELAYLEGEDFKGYLHDMSIAQRHAFLNREMILKIIVKIMKFKVVEQFQTIHNYIDLDNMILRKGSISAQDGEKVIIPMNMRDGSLICIGKGNSDWNYSAPHGAGRLMSRNQAKESISMKDFRDSMSNVFSTSVCNSTIDEAPQAYKPMDEIVENIRDTVEIIDVIKPVYNFKAH